MLYFTISCWMPTLGIGKITQVMNYDVYIMRGIFHFCILILCNVNVIKYGSSSVCCNDLGCALPWLHAQSMSTLTFAGKCGGKWNLQSRSGVVNNFCTDFNLFFNDQFFKLSLCLVYIGLLVVLQCQPAYVLSGKAVLFSDFVWRVCRKF